MVKPLVAAAAVGSSKCTLRFALSVWGFSQLRFLVVHRYKMPTHRRSEFGDAAGTRTLQPATTTNWPVLPSPVVDVSLKGTGQEEASPP